MAVTDEKDGALATAAVAAAAGVAAYGLRKALASSGGGGGALSLRGDGEDDEREDRGRSRGGSLLETAWDSASDTLLPLVEDAADAAGKWVAENSPDVIRERIVPRFIESFTDAA
ncbi:MAG: hypothetical protein ACJ75G_05785 [Gaiellaceae bacterium]